MLRQMILSGVLGDTASLRFVEAWIADRGYLAQLDVFDPSFGTILGQIPVCDEQLIDQAVGRLRESQPSWASKRPEERADLLRQVADRIEDAADVLAALLATETGKAIETECRGEVALAAQIFRYFADVCREIKGHTVDFGEKTLGFVTHHPVGVVAGIVPWNVPLMLMSYKVAAPLVAGNTVIVKMPEQATFSLLAVCHILQDVLPADVCEFVSGDGETTGEALVQHPSIDKVSFTGSVETGRHVYEQSARFIRPVTLELGGKSPMIILDDCDLEKAVAGIIASMRFTRAGQSCTAASRVFVSTHMMAQVQARLVAALESLVVGPALDPRTECGPVVSNHQQAKIVAFIQSARSDGIEVIECGTVLEGTKWDEGFFVKPHVIVTPPKDHRVTVDEIFGPVVCLYEYDSIDQALASANDTDFGLSASVWGRDISTCMTVAAELAAGIVQINQNAIMVPGLAYGGVKNSGIGRESSIEAMISNYMYSKTNILNYS